MFLFISFLLVLGSLVLIWDHLAKRRVNEAFRRSRFEGPSSYPLVGCLFDGLTMNPENMIYTVKTWFLKYGKTFRFWILNEPQIYTMDSRLFESILSATSGQEKADLYKFLQPFLNDGLLLSSGKKWHGRRKVFTAAFHFKILENYMHIFNKQSEILVEHLKKFADGETAVEMTQRISLAALDVITEAAMGVSCHAQSDPNFPYVKALKSVVYIQPNRMFSPKKRYDWLYRLLCRDEYQKVTRDIKTMQDFTINVIEKRRAVLEEEIANGTYKPLNSLDDDIGARPQLAFLDLLLQTQINGASLTNEEIREEVDTFMFEGDDTTTSCISHALYLLAHHPQVQSKALREIYEVIGKDRHIQLTAKSLADLKYLESVVKETLRLYPAVPAIGRKCDKDFLVDDMIIPANTSVYLVLIWAHRDPDFFPDPDSFMPERFIDQQDEIKKYPFSFVPFSAGPRNCIGKRFAMLEVMTFLTRILLNFELLPQGPDNHLMYNFIVRSSTGLHVGLMPRL